MRVVVRWAVACISLLWLAASTACGGNSSPTAVAVAAPGTRPNFVVIIADDMAYGLFGAGRRFPAFDMPNLARLAAQGVRFDRAFATTALCSPSRASILSGLYAHTHGVRINDSVDLPDSVPTFPQLMQRAGYQTAWIGKWHMDPRSDAKRSGFDHWVSFKSQGDYVDPLLNENGTRVRRPGYLTEILTEHAISWLSRRGPEPFLLVLSHKAAHQPWQPAPQHLSALADLSMPEPPSFIDTFKNKPAWQRRYAMCGGGEAAFRECPDPLPAELPPWTWSSREPWRLDYLRTLLALDDSVGTVMSALERQGLAASTYVVFLSDNGLFLGEHRFGDKRLAYEESMRIPLVISGRGLAPSRPSALTLNIDVAPTLLELAGLTVPGTVQGRSLVRLLRGEVQRVRDAALYEYYQEPSLPVVPTMVGIRTTRHKYVRYADSSDEGLYDLASDPFELTNLAPLPEWAVVKLDLRTQLARLLDETGGR